MTPAKRKAAAAASEYTAKHITVLEGLEPVRKRPGMYIGNTSTEGLHHLIWEVVDNAIDEAMAGRCDLITVALLPDHLVSVEDNGAGIPVDIHKQTGKSALEVVLTKLHAGAKFGEGGYKVSGGLHGVGVSVVNALSIYMKAEVKRGGKLWVQEYKRGKPQRKVRAVGKAAGTGTTITYQPDPEVFSTLEYHWETIQTHLRQQAYLTKGVTIHLVDKREAKKYQAYTFAFEGGVKSYVQHLNRKLESKQEEVFYADKTVDDIQVEIGFQYTTDFQENILAFCNNIVNPEGGTHLAGLRTALTRTLNNYARAKEYLKEKDGNLSGEDTREGLTAVIAVKVRNPQFEGQTKAKLGNAEVKPAVETVVNDALSAFLEEHPRDAEAILAKCLLAAKARQAARTARDSVLRRGALEGLTLPGKLADCTSRDTSRSELYIVEGDSAGGCFAGDTKVALADGRSVSMATLVEEDRAGKVNYCYTILPTGRIGIEQIVHPRMTKRNVPVVKVELDNGERIVCTPDHPFMLRDGIYQRADALQTDNSLMPLHRQLSRLGKRITIEGYEMVFDPGQHRWLFTHLLADEYNLRHGAYQGEIGPHRHHRDFNKRNNNPENLQRLTQAEHLKIHQRHASWTFNRPEVREKLRQIQRTASFRERIRQAMRKPNMRELLRHRAQRQWQDERYKRFMVEKFLAFYHRSAGYRIQSQRRLLLAQRQYWGAEENRRQQGNRVRNYFQNHPKAKTLLAEQARGQWSNLALRQWRAGKTRQQWTEEFRQKRKQAYNQTYLKHSLKLLAQVLQRTGNVAQYEIFRTSRRNNNLLKYDTLCRRFFDGNEDRMREAALHFNHRVISVRQLPQRIDVYDLEVPGAHNFALASGVFVHNSAKQGRDRNFQAVLPLRGKILNVEKARLDKMLANNELKSLIIALGTNIGQQFDLAGLRYDRIIIMTDADVDGSHIRTLLLTLFYRYLPQLISTGHLYIAQPPLFRVATGKEIRYVYTESELEKAKRELTALKSQKAKAKATGKSIKAAAEPKAETVAPEAETAEAKIDVQRYKGLGEMNPQQLWETTMDPATRMLKKVMVGDAEKADDVFTILMGGEVEPRKVFIQTHAKNVKNLDI